MAGSFWKVSRKYRYVASRPSGREGIVRVEFRPLVSRAVKEHHFDRLAREGSDISAVGRPTGLGHRLGIGKRSDLVSLQVNKPKGTLAEFWYRGPEGDGVPVRRPVRGPLILFARQELFRTASLRRNEVDLRRPAGRRADEGDVVAIRRPARFIGLHGRESELDSLAAVQLASPKGSVGTRDVSDPRPISGETQVLGREAMEVRHKLAGLGIVADQLSLDLRTDGKDLLPGLARDRRPKVHGSGGQLHRVVSSPVKEALFVAQRPEVTPVVADRLKNKILSVRGPVAATFSGWVVPARKQRVKVGPVGRDFPQRRGIGLRVSQAKSDSLAIRRPARPNRHAGYGNELVAFGPVALHHIELGAGGVSDLLPVG